MEFCIETDPGCKVQFPTHMVVSFLLLYTESFFIPTISLINFLFRIHINN
jgi:hypothetical protein